jgi:hypothetical protein
MALLLCYPAVAGICAWLGWRARLATKLALWFAFSLLPLALTVASGYVAYRSLPVAVPAPESVRKTVSPLFVHLSDPHFLIPARRTSTEGRVIDTRQAARMVALVIALRPRFLIISGDVTDAGAEEEWRHAVESLLFPVLSVGVKTIMAPGNHDMQPALLLNRGELPTQDQHWASIVIEAQVAARFLRNLSLHGPGFRNSAGLNLEGLLRAWDGNTFDFKLPAEEYQRCIQRTAGAALGGGHALGSQAMIADTLCKIQLNRDIMDFIGTYRSWFPLIHHDPSTGTTVVVLNSNDEMEEAIGSNAVGTLGVSQLERLREAFTTLPEPTQQCLIVMHHMPVRRVGDSFQLPRKLSFESLSASQAFQYSAMSTRLRDVRRLVQELEAVALRRPNLQLLLLCGHFHRRWLGQLSTRITIAEAGPPLETGGVWVGAWDAAVGRVALRWHPTIPSDIAGPP